MIGLEGVKTEVVKLKKALFLTAIMSFVGLMGLLIACLLLVHHQSVAMDYIIILQEQIIHLENLET